MLGRVVMAGLFLGNAIAQLVIRSLRYRNKRKHFGLRFNLICGIYNYELAQES